MGIKSFTIAQMYGISRALWVLTSCNEGWTPLEEDQRAMLEILDICEREHIKHHGLKSTWATMLDRPFSPERELKCCLFSADDLCSYYGYDVLATAIHYSELTLLGTAEISTGVAVMAQQIAWGIPKQLAAALQTAVVIVRYQPELLTKDILELVLIGLSQLLEQTKITSDDTVESASEKGSIRKEAAALARLLDAAKLGGERPEILEGWLAVIQGNNEFSEIRNA